MDLTKIYDALTELEDYVANHENVVVERCRYMAGDHGFRVDSVGSRVTGTRSIKVTESLKIELDVVPGLRYVPKLIEDIIAPERRPADLWRIRVAKDLVESWITKGLPTHGP